ncbi:MAG: hypothetical protein JXA21_19570 [Anaerolineae bacterium]|nr:hypothetical protein [Anaerolineae bacterium]
MNIQETSLWTWLLFNSGLPPQRAKLLLTQVNKQKITLAEVLQNVTAYVKTLGLAPDEITRLKTPPPSPAPVAAVRWNESHYPSGLQNLPLKLRPALLFYAGDPSLLLRPIVYIATTPLQPQTQEIMQEVIGSLLGEEVLLAVLQDSPQAEILFEEMRNGAGEAMLIVRQGFEHTEHSQEVKTWLESNRLLALTPLPPHTPANPAWNTVLEQVAFAAAWRCVAAELTSEVAASTTPTALLTPTTEAKYPPHIQVLDDPGEIALWLTDIPASTATATVRNDLLVARDGPSNVSGELPPALTELPVAPPEPPRSPADILQTLEAGGKVPEALKKRLLG